MIKLFKSKQPTVEEIHAEFDSGEKRILDECDKILNELKIPTETNIERKGRLLKELGFVNSETVKQAEELFERNKNIEKIKEITNLQAQTIRELKFRYPLEKFITVDELERICAKYDLIHAPVSNYVKDVPEKNVLDMKNCKELEQNDKLKHSYVLFIDKFWEGVPSDLRQIFKGGLKVPIRIDADSDRELLYAAKEYGGYKGKYSGYIFHDARRQKIDKEGFFVAAPKSHFNLEGLNKKSKFGFFKVETTELKDPVVFEYCKNDIVRIITKWGTEDDQSYLDPSLTNEINN